MIWCPGFLGTCNFTNFMNQLTCKRRTLIWMKSIRITIMIWIFKLYFWCYVSVWYSVDICSKVICNKLITCVDVLLMIFPKWHNPYKPTRTNRWDWYYLAVLSGCDFLWTNLLNGIIQFSTKSVHTESKTSTSYFRRRCKKKKLTRFENWPYQYFFQI